jgi:NAD+ synthase (glutamine-hydrolysing)
VSATNARSLASALGIDLLEVSATETHTALRGALPFEARGVVDENLQARARAALWMALANERNALVLATGNKSEIAVGYSTLYGDTTGALAPIADLYKTDVYRLAGSLRDRIPRAILERPPSAELRPDQRDEDDLPPYGTLDPLLRALIEENASRDDLIERGFDRKLVDEIVGRFHGAEFKRAQLPPGVALSDRPLGCRRVPLTHAWRG